MQKIKENKFLKYFWKTTKIISTILILMIITIIVTQRVFNNNVSILGYRIFTVATGSMEPEYKVKDMIFVREVDQEKIVVGDDLVYLGKEGDFKDKIITHRVISIDKEEDKILFHIKGIANPTEDPVIYGDQIYGKVIYKGVIISFINKIITSSVGFYLLIIVPVSILIFLEILDKLKEKELKENELLKEEVLEIDDEKK